MVSFREEIALHWGKIPHLLSDATLPSGVAESGTPNGNVGHSKCMRYVH